MDKKVADALKTLLEALPEEVVREVTSKLDLTASHVPEKTSQQLIMRTKLLNFRLTEAYEEILEAEAIRTGQSKTTVLKAALAMYNSQDENIKNHWLLESAKRG
ncbi:CopG family transcriptional regulator [Salmonella enterica]|nr:CopG family transcriptional regulator [Salmonella enterica subsp. enterica serovar Abaetetuba]EEN6708770.1 CopG family transcriptional regulator [Salmonella enterica subsp. enterica serovar Rubislaw]